MNRLAYSPSMLSTRCASETLPRVTMPRLCVWPLVNTAEPCARGSIPAMMSMGRISLSPLPSGRLFLSRMFSRTISLSISSAIERTWPMVSGNWSLFSSTICFTSALNLSSRPFFSRIWSSAFMAERYFSRIKVSSAASCDAGVYCTGGLPTMPASFDCVSHIFLIFSCASSTAVIMSFSLTLLERPSIMVTAFAVPATTRSMSLSAVSWFVGLTIHCPFTLPMRTAPTGPLKGRPDIASAAEAALMARTSNCVSPSAENV